MSGAQRDGRRIEPQRAASSSTFIYFLVQLLVTSQQPEIAIYIVIVSLTNIVLK
jgi:hypothetical protein